MKAEAKNISAEEKVSIVAVKIVSRIAEPIYINAIAKELKILMYVGRHLNILNLLGTCTDKIAKSKFSYYLKHFRVFISNIKNKFLFFRRIAFNYGVLLFW